MFENFTLENGFKKIQKDKLRRNGSLTSVIANERYIELRYA
jgi:hypothetical protein